MWVKEKLRYIVGFSTLLLAGSVFFAYQTTVSAATSFVLDASSGVTCIPNFGFDNGYTAKSAIVPQGTAKRGSSVSTERSNSLLQDIAKDPSYANAVKSIKSTESRPYIYFTPSSSGQILQNECNIKYGVFISDSSDSNSFAGITSAFLRSDITERFATGLASISGGNITFSIRSTDAKYGPIGSIIDTVTVPAASITGLADALTKPPFNAAGNTNTAGVCLAGTPGGCAAVFVDFNTITYGGDAYSLVAWNAEMKYQKVGLNNVGEQCKYFQIDTDAGGGDTDKNGFNGYDINIDNASAVGSVFEAFTKIKGLARIGIYYNDGTNGCNGKRISTSASNVPNFLKIFRYDDASKSLKPVVNSFGPEEARYFNGEYKQKAGDPNVFELVGGTFCAGNPSNITLPSLPKGNQAVEATWSLVTEAITCSKATAPLFVTVITATEKATADKAIAAATAEEAKPPITCTGTWRHAVSWIACGIISIAEGMINKIDEMLQKFLFVDVSKFDNKGALHRSWSNIRQFSTIILVIMALIMIFTEAMGSGILDNYSVKKILPRIVIAGIGIQLSWEISKFLINVGNTFGNGIQGVLLSPFGGKDGTNPLTLLLPGAISGEAKTFGFALAIGGLVAMGPVLGVATGVIVALIVAFVTLILRYMVIIMCMLFAPVFIALSVLPGTNKATKFWWESFEKAIIMYPLIMVFLAAGKIVAFGLITAGTEKDASGKIISQDGWFVLAGLIAAIAPYAAFPTLVSAAGGALKKLTGVVGDKSKGMIDGTKNWSKNRAKNNKEYKKAMAFSGINRAKFDPRKLTEAKTRGLATLGSGGVGFGTKSRIARGKLRNEQMEKSMEYGAMGLDKVKAKELEVGAIKTAYEEAKQRGQNIIVGAAEIKAEQTKLNAQKFDVEALRADMAVKEAKLEFEQATSKMNSDLGTTIAGKVNRDPSKPGYMANSPLMDYFASATNDAQRSAALTKMAELGYDQDIRDLKSSYSGGIPTTAGGTIDTKTGMAKTYENLFDEVQNTAAWQGSLKDKSPDLTKGPGAYNDIVQKSDRAKWTGDSWKLALGAKGGDNAKELLQDLIDDHTVARDIDGKKLEAINSWIKDPTNSAAVAKLKLPAGFTLTPDMLAKPPKA
jgi:hypothetical protein